MDIRQLKYFVETAREGQVTRAARKLRIEQPPLSRQLKLMEEELGVRLFDRTGKRLKLTSAGERLNERAEALLIQFDETIREIREMEEGVRGVLAIGSVVSCISLLPKRIEQFRKRHPLVTFKLSEGDHFYLGEQLEKREIELIVSRLPFEAMSDAERYEVLRLPSDPFVAVIPVAWEQFAGTDSIRLRELAPFPLLALKSERTTHMHDRVMDECSRHGFTPQIVCECSSVAIIMSLVAEGIGATIFPKSVMSAFPMNAVRMLDIRDADFQSGVGLVWLKDRYMSKLARRFIDQFRR